MSDVTTGTDLINRGWKPGPAIGLAKQAAKKLKLDRDAVLTTLDAVRNDPERYLSDRILGDLARALTAPRRFSAEVPVLRDEPVPYRVWGPEHIDPEALAQMDAAMRLPVTVAGALMPDAHVGYGLPIGGVLATEGTVIPYAVGVDIACRMRLSIYDIDPNQLDLRPEPLAAALRENTHFGAGVSSPAGIDHPVLEDSDWNATRQLRELRRTAINQIGTSGSGNHFVEWGELDLVAGNDLELPAGRYLALLSHSGSRGVGHKIATAYSRIASDLRPHLDPAVRHLAWLDLEHEAGGEYWVAMNLAGRFASANHEVIHHRVAAALGVEEIGMVENYHNFAWKQEVLAPDGSAQEAIVHRKGATPAEVGRLGVVPGSMADAGYVVRGRGDLASLQSAAHGAGRAMGRKAALRTITATERDGYLLERRVTLLGGGLDESPQAYKRIGDVMAAMDDLVDIVGVFQPRVVRMATEAADI